MLALDYPVFVLYYSLVGSLLSAVLNTRAAIKLTSWAGSPWIRLALITASMMSFLYFISYWWLLNNLDQGGEWSETIRPIGGLSWFIGPWITLPLCLEKWTKKQKDQLRAGAAQLIEEVRNETPPDSHGDSSGFGRG